MKVRGWLAAASVGGLLAGGPAFSSPLPSTSSGTHQARSNSKPSWSYEDPTHWGGACGVGKEQSPIDVVQPTSTDLPDIKLKYRASRLRVLNNGLTAYVAVEPGSFMTVGNQTYELVQFHFHMPSEHRIEGSGAEMEVQFVHKNTAGKTAVLAVLIRAGSAHPVLDQIWKQVPDVVGIENKAYDPRTKEDIWIQPINFIPIDRNYWVYPGSLTTPPCSEGVEWRVYRKPIEFSPAQIEQFRKWFASNARPVQPLRQRAILQSR